MESVSQIIKMGVGVGILLFFLMVGVIMLLEAIRKH